MSPFKIREKSDLKRSLFLTQNFRSRPSVRIFVPRLRRHPDGYESDDEGRDVRQHVERVRHQRHRVRQVADDDFDEKEARRQKEHRYETTFFTGISSHFFGCTD